MSQAVSATRQTEIRSLTGLRGVAACMVVMYHYFQDSAGFGPAHALIVHSYIAVDLFFVLSGFVMALTYGATFRYSFRLRAYGAFLGKRIGRIYPLYAVVTVTVFMLLLAHVLDGVPGSPTVLVSNLLMVQAWGVAESIGGPTWSISTEFAAYIVFPALIAVILNGPSYRIWVAAALSACVLTIIARTGPVALHQVFDGIASRNGPLDVFGAKTLYPLMRCFAGFTLGLVAFRMLELPRSSRMFCIPYLADGFGALVLGLWATSGSDLALEFAFVFLVMTLATGKSWLGGCLGSSVIYWFGEISYSIYLVHRPIEGLVRNPLIATLNALHIPHAFTVAGLAPLPLVLLMSAATFYGIEKPARKWSRLLTWGGGTAN